MEAIACRSAVPSDAATRDLLRAVDLPAFWQACIGLLDRHLPHHSCSLMLGMDGEALQPRAACHHVADPSHRDYQPVTSLSVSSPFLAKHPQVRLYTYSQILSQDRQALQRRLDQGEPMGEWAEFVHLAFWDDSRPLAVFSIRRSESHCAFGHDELAFLEQAYPLLDAGIQRLYALEHERSQRTLLSRELESVPSPLMLLDRHGEPVFVNAAARERISIWNGSLKTAAQWSLWSLPDGKALPWRRFGVHMAPYEVGHPALPDVTLRVHRLSGDDGLFAATEYFLVDFSGSGTGMHSVLLEKLSPSERRVAMLVAEGLRNYEIAERLSRSRRTVESQLNSIYAKLDVGSRVQLVQALSADVVTSGMVP